MPTSFRGAGNAREPGIYENGSGYSSETSVSWIPGLP
jgi:hypothetical protein